MNFWEDEQGGEGLSFLQRKWGSASLLVKPRRYSGKSPTFFGKSPTFFRKSPTFFRKSPTFFRKSPTFFRKSPTFLWLGPKLGPCWAVLGEQMQGKKESRGALGEKMGGFEGEVPPFSAFQSAQNSGDVRFVLKYIRKKGVNSCLIEAYEEIGEGCESKKCKIPVGRARARAREGDLRVVRN